MISFLLSRKKKVALIYFFKKWQNVILCKLIGKYAIFILIYRCINTFSSTNFIAMGHQHHKNISREDFMSFFRDSKKIKMLSDEDRTEIASKLLMNDRSFLNKFLNAINGGYDSSLQQLMEERNSLPVF
jgi:hypothetical protein